jgi:hypothetical protein
MPCRVAYAFGMRQRFRHSIGERRMPAYEMKVGANLGAVWEELKEDMGEAVRSKNDPIKLMMAPIVGAARIVLKAPTAVGLGIVGKEAEKHTGYETGHTIKEAGKELFKNPLAAVLHGLNVIDSALLDTIRAVGGYQGTTRTKMAQAMNRETAYTQAA